MYRARRRDILLVEDDDADAELALLALRRCGAGGSVTRARDGVEALEYLSHCATAPVLVLLDIKLPRLDGLAALHHLRAADRTRLLPVVMFTSSDLERDILESYRLGCNGYVRKPIDFADLLAAVRDLAAYWLDRNEPPSEKGTDAFNSL